MICSKLFDKFGAKFHMFYYEKAFERHWYLVSIREKNYPSRCFAKTCINQLMGAQVNMNQHRFNFVPRYSCCRRPCLVSSKHGHPVE